MKKKRKKELAKYDVMARIKARKQKKRPAKYEVIVIDDALVDDLRVKAHLDKALYSSCEVIKLSQSGKLVTSTKKVMFIGTTRNPLFEGFYQVK